MVDSTEISETQHFAFVEALKCRNDRIYWRIDDDRLGGLGCFSLSNIIEHHDSAELGIYTNPFLSKPGIGAIILSTGIALAQSESKLSRLFLKVFPENQRAINFYKKSGFSQIDKGIGFLGKSYVCMEMNLV
jgi:RimJ/RimL family protein N-acetyltransferase